jgi:hypothetical protein
MTDIASVNKGEYLPNRKHDEEIYINPGVSPRRYYP